jgi:transcriptional regulator with XRE-family HTH domain
MNKHLTAPYHNKLRSIRKAKGIRQLDVACKLGFSAPDRVSRWEKGQALPNIINLFKLALIYQVPPEDLYPDLVGDLAVSVAACQKII